MHNTMNTIANVKLVDSDLDMFPKFGYRLNTVSEEFSTEDMINLKRTWNNLEVDEYIESEFKYRLRRYSKLLFDRRTNSLEFLSSKYLQDESYNKLFGGQQRKFFPVSKTVLESESFEKMLVGDFDFFKRQGLLTGFTYEIGVHQMRTVTNGSSRSLVTPEGIHKDGHFAFAIHMINRYNVSGGVTRLYDNNLEFMTEFTLAKFGETLYVNDDMLYHEVTPINNVDRTALGFRDILIIEFY